MHSIHNQALTGIIDKISQFISELKIAVDTNTHLLDLLPGDSAQIIDKFVLLRSELHSKDKDNGFGL